MSDQQPEVIFLKGKQPQPEDYLWRYMNLKKFLSFLIDQKLHLKRLDQFEDKNDGIFANLLQLKYNLSKIKKAGKQIDVDQEEFKLRDLQKNLYASCWFVGNRESMAMWKIFSNPDSVAVRIKYKELKKLFKKKSFDYKENDIKSITLGKVSYYDFQNGKGASSSANTDSFIAFSKDESFSNEREFRIIVHTDTEENSSAPGIDFMIKDFNRLPFEIVFHPKAEDWGVKNLKDVMNKFHLNFKMFNSELNLRYWVGS
jgi:hypothetical protein